MKNGKKLKHLELIQNIVNRMARNSFLLKWWTTTLAAALVALFLKEGNRDYIFLVFFPVAIFWILDGYFLSQERLFRSLYDHVRKLDEDKIDFSMDTSEYGKNKRNSWPNSMFSTTLLFFYLPMVIIMLLITFWIN